jgi:hypothetical protein
MDLYLEKTAKKITDAPVFMRVGKFKDKTEVARLVKYSKPTEYEIVFDRRAINKCREKGPACEQQMRKVISHELAHISHPNRHSKEFHDECIRLGGGDRCVARGIERRRH